MKSSNFRKHEFISVNSYENFARKVRRERRFIWDDEEQLFLETVLKTANKREIKIKQGVTLWRAQQGVCYRNRINSSGDEIEEINGYSAERMKPPPNNAQEGRANSKGIPVLYLATTKRTAVSEARPWIGFPVSLAEGKIVRELKGIDLTHGYGISTLPYILQEYVGSKPVDAGTRERAVWTSIDNAFSVPANSDLDTADYAPTQVLAELFLHAGYEAILYRSQFDEKGSNVVVFDAGDVEIISCTPVAVTQIHIDFKQMGNAWYTSDSAEFVG